MNLSKLSIMASLLALVATSCNSESKNEKIIEQPEVKIENGQFTPEALMALGVVTDPKISPDGKKILYGVKYESVEQNKANRELWVMDIDGSNPTRLTKSAASETNAVWLDGGKKIAFLYPDGDNTQIWTMDADGSDRKVVSKVENGVDGFVISPDESKIAFISSIKYG